FDAALSEVLVTLCAGRCLDLPSVTDHLLGDDVATILRNRAITQITMTPSVATTVPANELPQLELLVVGGEECPEDVAERWIQTTRVINAYGPTEATVCASLHECVDGAMRGRVPIGRPIANVETYVLDA